MGNLDIKIVFFDMDGTIVQYKESRVHSTWGALGVAAGVNEEWDRMMDHYLSLSETNNYYSEWFERNLKCLAGIPSQPVLDKILPPPYTPGFLEFCGYLERQNIKKGIISGGLDLVAGIIGKEASLDFVLVQEIYVRGGLFTGRGKINVPLMEKGSFVKGKLAEYGLKKENAAFFGDAFNDIPAWAEVGLPLGMNAKTEQCLSAVKENFKDFYQARDYFEKLK